MAGGGGGGEGGRDGGDEHGGVVGGDVGGGRDLQVGLAGVEAGGEPRRLGRRRLKGGLSDRWVV